MSRGYALSEEAARSRAPNPADFDAERNELHSSRRVDASLIDRITSYFPKNRPQNAIITLSAEIYFLSRREAPVKMIYFRITGIYFPIAGGREAENRPILLQLPKNGDRFISLPRPFLPPPPRQTPRRT